MLLSNQSWNSIVRWLASAIPRKLRLELLCILCSLIVNCFLEELQQLRQGESLIFALVDLLALFFVRLLRVFFSFFIALKTTDVDPRACIITLLTVPCYYTRWEKALLILGIYCC